MKLIKVCKKDAFDSDAFYNWIYQKKEEAESFRGNYMKPSVYDIRDAGKLKLETYINVSGQWYYKQDIPKAQAEMKKCSAFLDKVVAECRKKFPEVKVDW